jgi:hypothetical protein
MSSWQVANTMFLRFLRLTYLYKDSEQDLATSLFTTDVNSSMTMLLPKRLARSHLKPSPLDKTFLGFAQVGTVFNPTAPSLSMASSTESKCDTKVVFFLEGLWWH